MKTSRRPFRPGAPASVAALLLVLLSSSEAKGQTPFSELVGTERAFAATSLEDGTRAAFLRFLAEDGIVFNPEPVNGRELWESRPPDASVLSWGPAIADVSRSGDLGYTSGPWSLQADATTDPAVWGHYVSVWRRGDDGSWTVAVDGGITHEAVSVPPEDAVTRVGPPPGSGAAPAAPPDPPGALARADAAYSMAIADAGFPEALGAYLAPEGRVYRDGARPFTGLSAALEGDAVTGGEGSSWEMRQVEVARSGDLGFTVGVAAFPQDSATESGAADIGYFRIWRVTGEGSWQVVLDLLIRS